MSKLKSVLTTFCLLLLLTACQTKQVIVDRPVYPEPPAEYFVNCVPDYRDNTVSDVINGLTMLVICERAKKSALYAWWEYNARSESSE